MKAVIGRLQAPRAIRSHLLRLLLVRSLGLLVLVAMVLFGQSLVIQNSGAELDSPPGLSPTWSTVDHSAYPGCIDAEEWPPDTWGTAVVAYSGAAGTTELIAFDRAWERTHNAVESDDLLVLGICA